jgi:predicted acylesterase/phospholipase RssA
MRYLCIGPGGTGIFTIAGFLKRHEESLKDVEEISGSSAGAILGMFLSIGYCMDEIIDILFSADMEKFVKIKVASFFTNFGFVDTAPIRDEFVHLCGCDPTFAQLDKKFYVAAFCLNTSETVYFSRDSHPDMKVIDAVLMSMSVPLIFSTGRFEGYTYTDGGTAEAFPVSPFLGMKPHEVLCIKLKSSKKYQENIRNHIQFLEALLRSTLNNRRAHVLENTRVVELDVGDMNVFDFSIDLETKGKLYTKGYDHT